MFNKILCFRACKPRGVPPQVLTLTCGKAHVYFWSNKSRKRHLDFDNPDTTDPNSAISLLFIDSKKEKKLTQISELVFRFESFIIFVECRDLDSAQKLVSLAIACGFKEFGITSVSKRVIVGIRCSIRFKVPLGDTQKIIIIYGIHWTCRIYDILLFFIRCFMIYSWLSVCIIINHVRYNYWVGGCYCSIMMIVFFFYIIL